MKLSVKQRIQKLLYPANIAYILTIVALILLSLFTKILRVDGTSMDPTYKDGDVLFSIPTSNINTGDVVSVYSNELHSFILKRVLAVGGDYVVSSPTEVIVNGETIFQMPYLTVELKTEVVPEGNLFLVGDNYLGSYDSRYFGSIPIGDESYKVIPGIRLPKEIVWVFHAVVLLLILYLCFSLLRQRKNSQKECNNNEEQVK